MLQGPPMTDVVSEVLGLLRFGLTGWLRPRTGGTVQRRTQGVTLAVVALAASLLFVFLALRGWLYPLNPDVVAHLESPFAAELEPHVWGGPTLVGAWAAHAAIAVAAQSLCLGIIWACRRKR